MKDEVINSIDSESGIIASLIHNPELSFYSEHLQPNHFTDTDNKYIYAALCGLAQKGIKNADAYNIAEFLASEPATRKYAEGLQLDRLNELIEMSDVLARSSPEEYRILVDNVLDASFRRDMLNTLTECRSLILDRSEKDIEQRVYDAIDDVMVEYSSANDVPKFADVIDDYWSEIESRQGGGYAGLPFKFSALNDYVTLEKGELIIFGAEYKQGKSIMLLNCAVDLLKQDKAVLYIDSELNSRLFTARLLANLTGIEYKRLASGAYSEEERHKITAAREWMKTRNFTHIYMPMYDIQSIYTTIKKVYHTTGIDVVIVDYFKGKSDAADAWESYADLGRFVDLIKNTVCGDMNIIGIGAAQATASGKLADSAKISRNASTIIMLSEKTAEEIEADGAECGNKKLRVVANRNGPQMSANEYIDLQFDGDHILYTQAKQHIPQMPY